MKIEKYMLVNSECAHGCTPLGWVISARIGDLWSNDVPDGRGGVVTVASSDVCDLISVSGDVYGKKDFYEGQFTESTAVIVSVGNDGGRVTTISGSEYELGEMDSDYSEMMGVLQEGGTVIEDWRITRDGDSYFLEGRRMSMSRGDDEPAVAGKIVSQDGNYLTIATPDDDDLRVLVCWRNVHAVPGERWFIEDIAAGFGVRYDEELKRSFGVPCRPNLFR